MLLLNEIPNFIGHSVFGSIFVLFGVVFKDSFLHILEFYSYDSCK